MAQVNNTSKVNVSQGFRDASESFVIAKMDSNPLFAKKACNPNKNIDDCLTYILNAVKNSGIQGFADDEVFSMAVHYYEEENRRYMERERQIRERENQRQRLEQEKEKIERFIQTKGKYFDITTFRNDNFVIVVLSSIEAYKHEGDTLRHCVFTNTYYDRSNSLILSARKVNDLETPIETIEFSLQNGKVIQCYGLCNRETEYHNEIISLVEQNAYKLLSA